MRVRKVKGKENGHLKITGILRIFSTPFYSRHARFRRDHNLEIDPDKCDTPTVPAFKGDTVYDRRWFLSAFGLSDDKI